MKPLGVRQATANRRTRATSERSADEVLNELTRAASVIGEKGDLELSRLLLSFVREARQMGSDERSIMATSLRRRNGSSVPLWNIQAHVKAAGRRATGKKATPRGNTPLLASINAARSKVRDAGKAAANLGPRGETARRQLAEIERLVQMD